MDKHADEIREEIRRRQSEAAGGRREPDRADAEQIRRIWEVTREAAKMLGSVGPEGEDNG